MTPATTTPDTVAVREDQVKLGLWLFLATVTILFAAFTSAYIVRRSGSDWRPVALPSILWLNSLVLAASSVAVEIANWRGSRGAWTSSVVAMVVGVAYLLFRPLAAPRDRFPKRLYQPVCRHRHTE